MKEEAKKLTDENLEAVTGGEKNVSPMPFAKCPKCGSESVIRHPMPPERRVDCECRDCGHRWDFRY